MKKYAIVFLSLLLVVSLPFAAHANIVTATGKYIINAVKHAPGGAKVHATDTVTGAKHVIKHGVSSADLGKSIGAGIVGFGVGTGAGLAFKAITGLALDAVDWVMDPANNQIKWKKKGDTGGGDGSTYAQYYTSYKGLKSNGIGEAAAIDLCRRAIALYNSEGGTQYTYHSVIMSTPPLCTHTPGGQGNVFNAFSLVNNPAYDPSAPPDGYKSVPLVDLAKKVIEQADGGNVDSQKTIEDYVTNLAKKGKLDAELDNATDITKPDEPTKPEDPDKDCPIGTTKQGEFCVKPAPDNVPLFCNQSDFTRKICDWIDWTQVKHDEPDPDAGKVDIKDKSEDLNIDRDRIDFTNQCPAPTPINTSVGGFPVSTELNYQPLCDFFTMLNPFVVGMGGISSALIIAGGARRG